MMNNSGKKLLLFITVLIVTRFSIHSQTLSRLGIVYKPGLAVEKIVLSDSNLVRFSENRSLFSFNLNKTLHKSDEVSATFIEGRYVQEFEKKVKVTAVILERSNSGIKGEMLFENTGTDTLSISNMEFSIWLVMCGR